VTIPRNGVSMIHKVLIATHSRTMASLGCNFLHLHACAINRSLSNST